MDSIPNETTVTSDSSKKENRPSKQSKKAPNPQKDGVKTNKRSYANSDAYVRMNFLFQAAHRVAAVATATQSDRVHDVAAFFCDTARKISQRSVSRLFPTTKRLSCTRCHTLLLPGETAKVRVWRQCDEYRSNITADRAAILEARRERKRIKREAKQTVVSDSKVADDFASNNQGIVRVLTSCQRCGYTNTRVERDISVKDEVEAE
jgi:RNase P subunit RPR2